MSDKLWPRQVSGADYQKLQEAIIECFDGWKALDDAIRDEFVRLDMTSHPSFPFSTVVFNLIAYANQRNTVRDLCEILSEKSDDFEKLFPKTNA